MSPPVGGLGAASRQACDQGATPMFDRRWDSEFSGAVRCRSVAAKQSVVKNRKTGVALDPTGQRRATQACRGMALPGYFVLVSGLQ
jgi:hypothetical protein